MEYYLGIDGGGTKTVFLLVNSRGEKLASIAVSTCHYQQIGLAAFGNIIAGGLQDVLQQASLTLNQLTAIFAAVPGYGEDRTVENCLHEILAKLFCGVVWDCGNDVLAGWAGSLALNPGVNILAGTGSMAYGRTAQQHEARAGGWGHVCGDEGSAYWLGKKLLELFTKQADGRLPRSSLYDLVSTRLNLSNDFDIINIVVDDWQNRRDKIAGLATILGDAAGEGDHYACQMYQKAAGELASLAGAVISNIKFDDLQTVPVSWSGGVFNSGEIILKPLAARLQQYDHRCQLVHPALSPESGAVLLARKLTGPVSQSFIEKLQSEESKV